MFKLVSLEKYWLQGMLIWGGSSAIYSIYFFGITFHLFTVCSSVLAEVQFWINDPFKIATSHQNQNARKPFDF